MDIRKDRGGLSQAKWGNLLENLAIVVLAFYPLRHIQLGLDLCDTGYNYANFQYIQNMDSMWFFSTYLTSVVGNLLTKLPAADTLMGMNLYTGLAASLLALMGYFFCTRKLGMPKAIVFAGEMLALSLCWCPTASFYNYLTYLFFLGSSILLYLGLTREKRGYLFWAGVFLGANVLVRFSNLPEMGMIVAVWAYDFIVSRPEKKEKAAVQEGFWSRTFRHTLWCLAGYVAALAALLGYIHIRYGISEYVAGIGRLFAMTDNATDYKPMSMIMGIVDGYRSELYWIARIGIIVAGGMALFAAAGWLEGFLSRRLSGGNFAGAKGEGGPLAGQEQPGALRILHIGVRVLWTAVCIAMIGWLYVRGFTSFLYYSYDPIWHPGAVFLMLTMAMAAVRILDRRAPKGEKLLGGMVILILLITPIGSNNGLLPAMNNLFLAGPFVLWESWRFLRGAGERRWKRVLVVSAFPAKGVLAAFLVLCLFQFGAFGVKFAFAEGTGIQEASVTVDNNEMLRNIKMSPQKAQWMTELSDYVNENGLQGQEVILYGGIPSLSYYLQMPFAFNSWSEMDSYSLETMERDMAQLAGEIEEKGKDRPVIILEETYARFVEGRDENQRMSEASGESGSEGQGKSESSEESGSEGQEESGAFEESGPVGQEESEPSEESGAEGQGTPNLSEQEREKLAADPKWGLVLEFLDAFGYEQTFRNGKFAVYR